MIHYNKINYHEAQALSRIANGESPPSLKRAYDIFEPNFDCITKTRVGASYFGDGPKFMCDIEFIPPKHSAPGCLIYSIGSNGDFSFEAAVYNLFGCEIHTFDPTDTTGAWASKGTKNHAIFHNIGLSGTKSEIKVHNEKRELLPLNDIVKRLGHANHHIDVLKVDCEGCEHKAFRPIWDDLMSNRYSIGQILIEIHGTNFTTIAPFFASAKEAGFLVYSKERNHWGCNGYSCVEYSLIHRSTARKSHRFLFDRLRA